MSRRKPFPAPRPREKQPAPHQATAAEFASGSIRWPAEWPAHGRGLKCARQKGWPGSRIPPAAQVMPAASRRPETPARGRRTCLPSTRVLRVSRSVRHLLGVGCAIAARWNLNPRSPAAPSRPASTCRGSRGCASRGPKGSLALRCWDRLRWASRNPAIETSQCHERLQGPRQ